MSQSLLSIVAPIDPARLSRAQSLIAELGRQLDAGGVGFDLGALEDKNGDGVHFASLHALQSQSSSKAFLLLELSGDGDRRRILGQVASALGDGLRSLFALASDWKDGRDLVDYLNAHQHSSGGGWFDNPGIGFVGAPGMNVGRIRSEAAVAERIALLLEDPKIAGIDGSLERLGAVRDAVKTQVPPSTLSDAAPQWSPTPRWKVILRGILPFIATYLWPVLLLDLLIVLVAGYRLVEGEPDLRMGLTLLFSWASLRFVLNLLFWSAVASIAALAGAYVALRKAEDTDSVDERAPIHDINAHIFERENRCRQNHMISITVRKPGPLRSFTSRLVFWVLSRSVGVLARPGFLGTIGTIHFARWITLPGTRDVVFLSNYDGSWESYLEDFITRARQGLTGVWSNSIGFPRTRNLVSGGAADSERFKRYARRSMVPTLFWYSAYPQLTMATIRSNREIVRGLTGAMTEEEATNWLSLFGSAARPPSKIASSQVQSLLFGGLGFMHHARCLVFERLNDDRGASRAWLDTVRPWIAYNDGRRLRLSMVVILGLGPGGLRRLGLPQESLETFPFAFLEGMTGPGRQRILSDDSSTFRWGRNGADAVLIVYGETRRDVDKLATRLTRTAQAHGIGAPHVIPLMPVSDDKTEPFGFVDGISNPVIRGTYKGLRDVDPIHLVEAGEFILGYPDGRGNMPPGPTLSALHDPDNLLPLVAPSVGFDRNQVELPRDIGANGSFLVIRQLEQDVKAFGAYCAAEAKRLASDRRFPQPYVVNAEFIGAKLVGRWKDGSSLARFPYESRTVQQARHAVHGMTRPAAAAPAGQMAVQPPVAKPSTHRSGDNDFLFGEEDPEGLRCPYGAHIRRSNPRDSLGPGLADEIDITNRHRILRVGRPYVSARRENPGILFMCLNGDLERQFEFVQQTWAHNPAFHGLNCEKDPILGDGQTGVCSFTIATRQGPVRLSPMSRFVTTLGGAYVFLPSKKLVEYLSKPA